MNGIIVLNKPAEISSNTAVNIVKKAVDAKKAGHLGTLDVLGDGVLPITLGKSTRLFDFFLTKRKTYQAIFAFGFETETLDAEGKIVEMGSSDVEENAIKEKLNDFVGKISQVPPLFSALKKNGRTAYEIARKGEKIALETREIEVFSFKLLGIPTKLERKKLEERFLKYHTKEEFESVKSSFQKALYKFEIECGAGTYIRSLCRDLAHSTATCGTMLCITRTKCGRFSIDRAYSLEQIKNGNYEIVSPFDVVDLPTVFLSKDEGEKLLNGKNVFKKQIFDCEFKIVCGNEFFGIGTQEKSGKIKIKTFLLERDDGKN